MSTGDGRVAQSKLPVRLTLRLATSEVLLRKLDSLQGRLAKGGLQKDLCRKDDRLPNGSSRLELIDGVCPSRRRAAGRDVIEARNTLLDPRSKRRTAGTEARRPGLAAQKHRYQRRRRSQLPVDEGAIHQMERELRAEPGKTGGRPRTGVVKWRDAKVLYRNFGRTADEVCKVVRIGRRKHPSLLTTGSQFPTTILSGSQLQLHPARRSAAQGRSPRRDHCGLVADSRLPCRLIITNLNNLRAATSCKSEMFASAAVVRHAFIMPAGVVSPSSALGPSTSRITVARSRNACAPLP